MKCPSCKKENIEGSKFCSNCGSKIELENKCPNCGNDFSIGAKFCSNCGTILSGNDVDYCPHCGSKIPSGAKFCGSCGKSIGSIGNDGNTQPKSKWWNDPFNILILVAVLLICWNWIFKDILNKFFPNLNDGKEIVKDLDEDYDYDEEYSEDYSDDDGLIVSEYKVRNSRKVSSEKSSIVVGDAVVSAIEDGYSIGGSLKTDNKGEIHNIECDDFDVNQYEDFFSYFSGITCEFTGNDDLSNDYFGIYFDNSWSDNGNDKAGPSNRIIKLEKKLNDKNFPNGSKIKFTFTYGTGSSSQFSGNDLIGAVYDDKAFYEFEIDKNSFDINPSLVGKGGKEIDKDSSDVFFSSSKKRLDLFDVKINFAISGDYKDGVYCNGSDHSYTCFDAKSVFKKFKQLYDENYSKDDGKHRGNLILNVLSQDIKYPQYTKMYILSDGEFEMGGGWSVDDDIEYLKWKSGVSKSDYAKYPTTNFHVKIASHYRDGVYEKFWDDAINALQKRINKKNSNSALPKCSNNKDIYLVGVNQNFGNILNDVYKKIFDGCTVYID